MAYISIAFRLKLSPYKVQIVQECKCCELCVDLVTKHPDNIHHLLMTVKLSFDLSGFVNKQNMQYWSETDFYGLHM